MKKITSILLALVMVLSIPTGIFANQLNNTNTTTNNSSICIKQISEQEYLESLAKKHNVSIEEAKILNEENTQEFLQNQVQPNASIKSIKVDDVVNRIGYARVYKTFKEQSLKVEIGVPCKVSMGNTAWVFVSGSVGEGYALELGGGDFEFKKAFINGDISGLQTMVVHARGNFEMQYSDAISANIALASWTRSVNNIYRSPARNFSFTENL